MLTKRNECIPSKKYSVPFDEIEMEPFYKRNDIDATHDLERYKTAKQSFLSDVKDFCNNSTFHGIRYVTESSSIYRR